MRWAPHVAGMEEMINTYKLAREPENGTDHLENQGVQRRIILKCISVWWCVWTGFVWLRTGTSDGLL
jgi:hypothetical protein